MLLCACIPIPVHPLLITLIFAPYGLHLQPITLSHCFVPCRPCMPLIRISRPAGLALSAVSSTHQLPSLSSLLACRPPPAETPACLGLHPTLYYQVVTEQLKPRQHRASQPQSEARHELGRSGRRIWRRISKNRANKRTEQKRIWRKKQWQRWGRRCTVERAFTCSTGTDKNAPCTRQGKHQQGLRLRGWLGHQKPVHS